MGHPLWRVGQRGQAWLNTMRTVTLRSPAKINWTLDVLGRRDDGYHEVRTVLQTIALSDTVTVSPADEIEIVLDGDVGVLVDEPAEDNIAYRAAALLQRECDVSLGATINLHKRTPIASGFGGGSSNAATALRALRTLWRLSLSDADLARLAAQLGADVPFFLTGGTALGVGSGDQITPLPDIARQRLLVAWSATPRSDKTAEMYAALEPADFADGSSTDRFVRKLKRGTRIADADLMNCFESVLRRVDPAGAQPFADAHALGKPHLAGSGPGFFFLLPPVAPADGMIGSLTKVGLGALETYTLPATDALAPA